MTSFRGRKRNLFMKTNQNRRARKREKRTKVGFKGINYRLSPTVTDGDPAVIIDKETGRTLLGTIVGYYPDDHCYLVKVGGQETIYPECDVAAGNRKNSYEND